MNYSELNTKLIEAFGELEQICNQMYNSQHGVTSYIDEMYSANFTGRNNVYDWDYKLRRLKDIRHKRNKLSHGEISFNTMWATQEDIQFIFEFKQSIFAGNDPLSVNHKLSIKNVQPQKSIQYSYYPPTYSHRHRHRDRDSVGCIIPFIFSIIFSLIVILFAVYLIDVFQ